MTALVARIRAARTGLAWATALAGAVVPAAAARGVGASGHGGRVSYGWSALLGLLLMMRALLAGTCRRRDSLGERMSGRPRRHGGEPAGAGRAWTAARLRPAAGPVLTAGAMLVRELREDVAVVRLLESFGDDPRAAFP